MSKYWNEQGQYQAEFEKFTVSLMPRIGAAESLAGELVRSANRIYYDAFNNGFCNNTSGAVNFLKRYLTPAFPEDVQLESALNIVKDKCNTGGYGRVDAEVKSALDLIVDRVVEALINDPQLITTTNPCDMFDLQEDDFYDEDEDSEEEDSEYYR